MGHDRKNWTGTPRHDDLPRLTTFLFGPIVLLWAFGCALPVFNRQPPPGSEEMVRRVSVQSVTGAEANGPSYDPSLSADGLHVAFASEATNLLSGIVVADTNAASDVFVHDLATGLTTIVSIGSNHEQGDGASRGPSISADGRYVAFSSKATNLVENDTNDKEDVFVHDRMANQTTRVSVQSGTGVEGNNESREPSISADGRYVAFASFASNLLDTGGLPAIDNGHLDVFVHDRQTGTTIQVSVGPAPTYAQPDSASSVPCISADGGYVAFQSLADNLLDNRNPANAGWDMYLRDLKTNELTRVSAHPTTGVAGDASTQGVSLSADGRYVALGSHATNLLTFLDNFPVVDNGKEDVYVLDRQTKQMARISIGPAPSYSQGDDLSGDPSLSADGRCVAFTSAATNLVANETNTNGVADVYVRDRETDQTTRASLAMGSALGNNVSAKPSISADGRYVAFHSLATNLVYDDNNGTLDIFVRDRGE